MLYHGAASGAMDLTSAVMEVMTSMRRAGMWFLKDFWLNMYFDALFLYFRS